MDEVVEWLDRGDPDADGTPPCCLRPPVPRRQRPISRIVQSLVLAREGLLAPEFVSIEEHLGRNPRAYYETLKEVQHGTHQPERDAGPWVDFCV